MSLSKSSFYDALAEFIRDRGYDVAEVTSFEEVENSTGGCETCYYEYTEVYIYYKDADGNEDSYQYYGDMGELVRELTD